MKANKSSLSDVQTQRLKTLLISPEMAMLKEVIGSELALAQIDLLDNEIYKEESESAKAHARNLRLVAQKYTSALQVLNDLAKESKALFTVTISP